MHRNSLSSAKLRYPSWIAPAMLAVPAILGCGGSGGGSTVKPNVPDTPVATCMDSSTWCRGKDNWLFLGDSYEKTISKTVLKIIPKESETEAIKEVFSTLAKTSALYNTKVVLLIGPEKSSVYPEYLPDGVIPSSKKYISFFLEKIDNIPNLTVYNPTNDMLRLKSKESILYYRTDTHWNNKGAFLAYSGLSKILQVALPDVDFIQSSMPYPGDLIYISNLKEFPLNPDDSWDVVWKNTPITTEKEISTDKQTAFGPVSTVINENPLSNSYAWVCGDSFSSTLRPYLNATFKEVRYVGHWSDKLNKLAEDLVKADRKPDLIIIEKVERFF